MKQSAAVIATFRSVHQGRSTDDVVIDDELNESFLARCRESISNASDFELNWSLFNARKRSAIGRVTTVRDRRSHDDYLHAAEIAARHAEDKYGLTVDRVLCDPQRRAEFDKVAQDVASETSVYLPRKAALKLRKARQLRPELVKRVADWGIEVMRLDASTLQVNPELIPRKPGIYLLSDSTGLLYVGEAVSLRVRIATHLDHSDRRNLARYLWKNGAEELTVEIHVFEPQSNGRYAKYRKAYESDLIQSRNPRFNIRSN